MKKFVKGKIELSGLSKKPRAPHVKPPSFDSSGSVVIRVFDRPAEVGVHWCSAKVSQFRLVCPDTMSDTKSCLCCAATKQPPSTRMMSLAWDVKESRWCVYMAHPLVFKEIFEKCVAAGASPEMIKNGQGPDLILQRIGKRTIVGAIPETLGIVRGSGQQPFSEYVDSLEKMSLYKTLPTPAAIEAAYADIPFEETLPKDEPDGEGQTSSELDEIKGEKRWDFM